MPVASDDFLFNPMNKKESILIKHGSNTIKQVFFKKCSKSIQCKKGGLFKKNLPDDFSEGRAVFPYQILLLSFFFEK